MATKRFFLVARAVDGHWQHVSHTGYHYGGAGACHPLGEGMTERDHEQIRSAVVWMAADSAVRSVDLTADSTYRLSWR